MTLQAAARQHVDARTAWRCCTPETTSDGPGLEGQNTAVQDGALWGVRSSGSPSPSYSGSGCCLG